MFIPKRRDYTASLDFSRVSNWNKNGRLVTHYLNGLSPLFPDGERFFLDSVRNYRSQITTEPLKKSVDGFIGQEVMHGKMHDQYDEALKLAKLPAPELERLTRTALKRLQKITSPKIQLAITCAAEHYTASMAKHLLDNPHIIQGSEESYAWLWQVHAIEEFEHRSVTYDVYKAFENDYLTRCVTFFLVSLVLFPVFVFNCVWMATRDPKFKLSLWELVSFVKVVGGMWIDIAPELSGYFKPGFHPDDTPAPVLLDEHKRRVGFT